MLAMGLFTSCQKETESAQQLAEELTAELQKVTDYRTAEAAAPRVKVLNQRFQNASTQVLSLNFNPLAESVKPEEEGGVAPYVETITKLAKEIGRVRASKPVTTHDGEIDDTRLLQTVGANAGAGADAGAAATLKKGNEYMKNPTSRENNNPPGFAECYGSDAMVDALSYTAAVEERAAYWDSEESVPAVPAEVAPAEEDEPTLEDTDSGSSDDSGSSSDDSSTPASSDDADTTPDIPTTTDDDDSGSSDDSGSDDTSSDDDSGSDDGDVDVDIDI